MGLRLRSQLIVRVPPNRVGVGVALDHLRRFVRGTRLSFRCFRIALFVGIVARPLQVRQNVV